MVSVSTSRLAAGSGQGQLAGADTDLRTFVENSEVSAACSVTLAAGSRERQRSSLRRNGDSGGDRQTGQA